MSEAGHDERGVEEDTTESVDARRIVEWVIVAGLAIGLAAAAFLVWEAWSANRQALDYNSRQADDGARVYPYPRDSPPDPAASDPGPPPSPEFETS